MTKDYLKGKCKALRWRAGCVVLAIDVSWILLEHALAYTLSTEDWLTHTLNFKIYSVSANAWAIIHAPIISLATLSGLLPTTFDLGYIGSPPYLELRYFLFYVFSTGYSFVLGFVGGLVCELMNPSKKTKD